MIFHSTGLFKKYKTSHVVNKLISNKVFNIELSAGLYEKNIINFLIKKKKENPKINFLIHNYFPASKNPFVLNLSSNNSEIKNKSIKLAKRAIKISRKLDAKFYGFHAGFLIDPKIKSLGKTIDYASPPISRSLAQKNFIKSVIHLSKFAKKNKVNLLIENNVLSKKNYKMLGYNPLLFVDADEIKFIMKKTPKNVNILLDVAHLNVSSKTLKFNKLDFFKKCEKWIKSYHLSDNDGLSDNNKFVTTKSWFWKHLKKKVDSYTLETRSSDIRKIKKQIQITNIKINKYAE